MDDDTMQWTEIRGALSYTPGNAHGAVKHGADIRRDRPRRLPGSGGTNIMTSYVYAARIDTPDDDPTDLTPVIADLIERLRPDDYTISAYELTNVDAQLRPDGELFVSAHAEKVHLV